MDQNVINNIKSLGIDMIKEAGSGHPGIVLGAAPIIYTLFSKHMMFSLNDPNWINRDRFVMSAGHGSALLYATLYMIGYLKLDDLKKFRQIDSKTPGHPEYGMTLGVEATTGPLGQGIAMAVGLALGEKILENKYKIPKSNNLFDKDKSLFNYHVYCLCSDGDLMEGISYEAASLAGTWKLNNLIVLYDSNHVSLDGKTTGVFDENVRGRFEALGWHTIYVENGNNINEINKAITKAKDSNKPTLIEIKTIIGDGTSLADTNEVHGKVLGDADIYNLKKSFGFPEDPFYVMPNIDKYMQREIALRTSRVYSEWAVSYRDYIMRNDNDQSIFDYVYKKYKDYNLSINNFNFNKDEKEETRKTNQQIMNVIAQNVPYFIGGSADLFGSAKNYLNDYGDLSSENYLGRNIHFGVREHAMGAIMNGLSLTGFSVHGSTFLSFADYMKPAIRLAALMHLPTIHIFSHDSITLGSDGPTHQPVEQLTMLRTIPNNKVYRPCDANELIGCWNEIINTHDHPSSLIITKTPVTILDNTDVNKVKYGAYIVRKETEKLHGIIIATGPEVHIAMRVANKLYGKYKLDLRVISMPCMETFKEQNEEYKKELLPLGIKTIAIEFGSSALWYQFVYNDKYLINVNEFGHSGNTNDILKKMHLDNDSIEEKIKKLFL